MFAELNCLKSFKWFLTDYRIKFKLSMLWPLSVSSDLLPTTSQHTKTTCRYLTTLCFLSIYTFVYDVPHTRWEPSHFLLILNSQLKWYLLWEVFPDLWRIKCFWALVRSLSLVSVSVCLSLSYLSTALVIWH